MSRVFKGGEVFLDRKSGWPDHEKIMPLVDELGNKTLKILHHFPIDIGWCISTPLFGWL